MFDKVVEQDQPIKHRQEHAESAPEKSGASDAAVQRNVDSLKDQRVPATQRQAIAQQLSRNQGNQYLRRKIAGKDGEAARQSMGVSPTSAGVIRRATQIGTFTYNDSFSGARGTVNVRARNLQEWQTFLRNDADEVTGNIELNVFMAQATGESDPLGGIFMRSQFSGTNPTEDQAITLMQAYLTVGSNIDLPDWGIEGMGQARAQMARHMNAFNGRFAARAIARMSQSGNIGPEGFDAIKAYAEDAADMQSAGAVGARQNPVTGLIASSLGGATGAASEVARLSGEMARLDRSSAQWRTLNLEKQTKFIMIENSAKVAHASLEQANADRQQNVAAVMAIYKTAMAAVGVATSGTAAIVLKLITPAMDTFVTQLLAGNGKRAARQLLTDFGNAVDQLVQDPAVNMDAGDGEHIKNAFSRGMTYGAGY